MKVFNLCLLGFGNVARALVPLLVEKSEEMRERFRIEWRVTGVATRRVGWLAAPGGFRVGGLLSGEITSQVSPQPSYVEGWLAASPRDLFLPVHTLQHRTERPSQN